MSRTLKTAVFGTGFVGRVHMEAIVRTGFVELYGLSEAHSTKPNYSGRSTASPK